MLSNALGIDFYHSLIIMVNLWNQNIDSIVKPCFNLHESDSFSDYHDKLKHKVKEILNYAPSERITINDVNKKELSLHFPSNIPP